MLSVVGLTAFYGTSQALFDVRLDIGEGEIVALLGRNGMGKTTTVRAIMGLVRPGGGAVRFRGQELAGMSPEAIARQGIGLVPEGRQIFSTLSVAENLVATAANRLGAVKPWTLARVLALFPALASRLEQRAASLSGGEQQMLAIGRALMTNPRLLVLDEATEGLAPLVRDEIWHTIRLVRESGIAVVVVDKTVSAVLSLADRITVLVKGGVVYSGSPQVLREDAELMHRHLGV